MSDTMSRFRAWRTSAGLSLAEVSDLSGHSTAFLSRLERGERGARPETKVRLARCLGVRVRDLFDVEEVAEDAG